MMGSRNWGECWTIFISGCSWAPSMTLREWLFDIRFTRKSIVGYVNTNRAIMRGQERISNEIVLLINFVAVFLCVASRNRMFDLQCKNWHTMCWLLSKHTKMLEKRFITVEFPVVFLPRCGDLYAALSWLGFSMPERLAEVKLLRMKTYTLHSFWEGEIFGEFSVYISLYSSRTSHAHRGSGQRLVWTNCYYYYLCIRKSG